VDAGSDPCDGLCGQYKCEHRPKLMSEWTFWTYHPVVECEIATDKQITLTNLVS
jgi:hypothetical protein